MSTPTKFIFTVEPYDPDDERAGFMMRPNYPQFSFQTLDENGDTIRSEWMAKTEGYKLVCDVVEILTPEEVAALEAPSYAITYAEIERVLGWFGVVEGTGYPLTEEDAQLRDAMQRWIDSHAAFTT